MSQDQGYPTVAVIESLLAACGVEMVTENLLNFYTEDKQHVYGILQAIRWAITLRVFESSKTTFKVVGGKYRWNNTVKTYTTGAAIDPTDNDTTYVWMADDNTIGCGIDGDGWPGTDHIKLAEVVVDADGVITSITDLRSEEFLRRLPDMPDGDIVGTTDTQTLSNKTLTNLKLTDATELTIAAGAVTGAQAFHKIDTESDAATDDLDTITATNYAAGDLLLLIPENAARVVTVKNGTGNINLRAGDYAMSDAQDVLVLRYDGSAWQEVSRSNVVTPAGTQTLTNKTHDGAFKLTSLPTSDPLVAGQVWNDSGTLKLSSG